MNLTDVELLASIEEVTIEGIIIDPKEGSSAIINGEILKEGDYLGGFRVTEIFQNTVEVERDDKTYTLTYRENEDTIK